MGIIAKIIRKSGMGRTAYLLLRSLYTSTIPDISPEKAAAELERVLPSTGGSCLSTVQLKREYDHDLDIITPVYNCEKFLYLCIDSVLSQKTVYDFRLMLVDDGSTDGSAEIIAGFSSEPRIISFRQANAGTSAARNFAIEKSTAKYVLFLDADDRLAPGAVDALIGCAEKNGAAFVQGTLFHVLPSGEKRSRVCCKTGQLSLPEDYIGFPCGNLFRRECFGRIRFPGGFWFEDSVMRQVLIPTLSKAGSRGYGIPDTTFFYTVNPSGIINTSKRRHKSIDSLRVTLQLHKDRQELGLEADQEYYEYILRMIALTYRRTQALDIYTKQCIFVLWREFLETQFGQFGSERPDGKLLETEVRAGDYARYDLLCRLV